ncbi:heparinase II/III domain-containing protein [Paenibacillus cymbidii]|uniref:heparinase II/III domain-containing protein n=1 Tax=Paenibacillus cymbidii TaxID=1639034 RepID=UPI00108220D7|nr:heparinase II/III family protein [Paenibacillus cymbidii]
MSIGMREIREALRGGDRDGYTLFPEIRLDVNRARVKEHPVARRKADELLRFADAVKDAEPQRMSFAAFRLFGETGDRRQYQTQYFNSRKETYSLALAEVIEDNGSYVQALEERLWLWCDLYTWDIPASVPLSPGEIEEAKVEADEVVALFGSETGFYMAEILSVVGHKLHPLLVHRLKKQVFSRIIDSYRRRTFWWEEVAMNWASVCAGAVGCAALYLIEDADELSVVVSRILATMETYLSGFDRDGITAEGLGYWTYGFSFYVYFAELLKERTNGRLDLMDARPILRRIAEMPLYTQLPDSTMINFSDAPGSVWHGEYGLLCRLSERFGIAEYKLPEESSLYYDHTNKWAHLSRSLFWGLNAGAEGSYTPRTGCFYFPESQWLIDRRGGGAEPFRALAVKGGHNGEPHNHNDLGHFILHFNGDNLFCDLGAPEYVKAFFSDRRYTFLHASSEGHSVPIVNGRAQAAGAGHYAKVVDFAEGADIRYALDLTAAYDAAEFGMESYIRHYCWHPDRNELTIEDRFAFAATSNTIEEVFVTPFPVQVVRDGHLRIHGEHSYAELRFDPAAAVRVREEAYKAHSGRDETVNRIVIAIRADSDCVAVGTAIRVAPGVV